MLVDRRLVVCMSPTTLNFAIFHVWLLRVLLLWLQVGPQCRPSCGHSLSSTSTAPSTLLCTPVIGSPVLPFFHVAQPTTHPFHIGAPCGRPFVVVCRIATSGVCCARSLVPNTGCILIVGITFSFLFPYPSSASFPSLCVANVVFIGCIFSMVIFYCRLTPAVQYTSRFFVHRFLRALEAAWLLRVP